MPPADLFYFILGLAIGSFLNVCIYRIPRKESIVSPRSRCPKCGEPVKPYDNVPVFSYLWLRGRCRFCHTAISLRYPAVELLTGLAFLACAREWHFDPATYVNSLFLAIVIALAFIDYDHQIIPNVLTLPGIVAGILLSPWQSPGFFRDGLSARLALLLSPDRPESLVAWTGSILGALMGGGLLLAVGTLYQAFRKRQGLGMGDIKMMAMVGAFVGWRLAFLTIFAGSVLGSLAGIFLILFRGEGMQSKLAFGTFLGCGAAVCLFYGLSFVHWYVRATF